jgi:hypothetical protein
MEPNIIMKAKHIIILGAGASASSGYPVGNDLRLWMSSPQALKAKITTALDLGTDADRFSIFKQFDEWIKPLENALKLFREGDFASVDEFCKLAGSRLQSEVVQLKRVLRLALSVHNPEDHYEQSEYYGFVQRLFERNLVDLRDDVVVLSFNYDVYLEFLLTRALRVRQEVAKGRSQMHMDLLTSGFSNRNTKDIESSDGFCFLKLHGAIAWPRVTRKQQSSDRDAYCWYGDLFGKGGPQRIHILTSADIAYSDAFRTVIPI